MKHLLAILLLAACAATAQGQIIKSLGFNTTNGNVVYAGTNKLSFSNAVALHAGNFSNSLTGTTVDLAVAIWDTSNDNWALRGNDSEFQFNGTNRRDNFRIALGLGATWLTNTSVTNFRSAIGLGATNEVQFAHIDTTTFEIVGSNGVVFDLPIAAGATRTNLGLGLPAFTNTSNVTTMRALAGSTNTNEPFSGLFNVSDPEASVTWALTFSNGILIRIEEI